MYKIKEFAEILGVTTKTLRNKDKEGLLKPSYINPKNNYRLYSDELVYRYDNKKYIIAYLSYTDNVREIRLFESYLDSLKIEYKLFVNKSKSKNFLTNEALKALLRDVNSNNSYHVLYDEENIKLDDLNLINFYIDSCHPNMKVKTIEDFTLENNTRERKE